MAKVVVGMFGSLERARDAVSELVNNGIPRDQISLVAGDERGEMRRYVGGDTTTTKGEEVVESAAGGAGIGAVLGGLGGLVLGLGALAIPGVGPIIAAGPLAAALGGAVAGAATGGLLGALVELGIPEERAKLYQSGIQHGNILVTARTSDEMASMAMSILNRYQPIDVDQKVNEWRTPVTGTNPSGYAATRTESDITRSHDQESSSFIPPVSDQSRRVGTGSQSTFVPNSDMSGGEDAGARLEGVKYNQADIRSNESNLSHTYDRPGDFSQPVRDEDRFTTEGGGQSPYTKNREGMMGEGEMEHGELSPYTEDIPTEIDREETQLRGKSPYTKNSEVSMGEGEMDHGEMSPYTGHGDVPLGENYQVYYDYGHDLHLEDRYQGRSWDDIEPDVRRNWETHYANTPWEEFKAAVRRGWDELIH